MKYKQLIFLLLFLLGSTIYAQLSKTHYIPPLTSGDAGFREQFIYISTPSLNNVNFTINPIGNSIPSSYQGVVTNLSPKEIAILNESGVPNDINSHLYVSFINTGNKLTNKGLIITADEPIFVSIRVRSSDANRVHAGALVSKGEAALGTAFRIGGFKREITPAPQHVNFASIMATKNGTKVTITDLPSGIVLSNGASPPLEIDLNQGESYIIAVRGHNNLDNTNPPEVCNSNCSDPRDLIGGLIFSNEPIVVNSGSAQGSFGGGGGQDYGFDQIVGADKIGKEYILVRGALDPNGLNNQSDRWENALVIAHKPGTEVYVNSSTNPIILNNAGDHIVIEGDDFIGDNYMHIRATENIFVYQGVGGIDASNNLNVANSGLFFVPPLSCESIYDVDNIPLMDTIGGSAFNQNVGVTIVTTDGANITINGSSINSISSSDRIGPVNTNVPSKSDPTKNYVTYKISNLSGNVSVKSGGSELYCSYFNASGFATTSAFYSGFPIPPTINFDVSSAGCISTAGPPALLTATNVDTFDSYEWQYLFDEGIVTDPTDDDWRRVGVVNSSNFNPTQIGQYRLVGTTCSGDQYISPIIPLSQCASDIDNDGVIDNLDVDMDNDGILNCSESYGNISLNLADVNNVNFTIPSNVPQIRSVSTTFTKDISTNSFTGDSSGNFISSLTTSSASSNRYNLNFNGKVNFKMTPENLSDSTDEDFFILRIGPNTKNISIINNDDQLLIDSDFDGVYESGVQRLDAYEIRFKINTSVSNGTFEIVAKEVESVTFEHYRLNGSSTTSLFSGKIELTCFPKDSDGDGIQDALDLDSDNDGIPDLYENSTKVITLQGDSNNDGLDDIFGPNPNLTDTDNDLIPNYLDLDSDNDGIYDIIESGFVSLSHTNGMITGVNPTDFGNNGLLNLLETNVDSGILKELPLNSDANSDDVYLRDEIFNFADLDSDGDACFDVLEAGFKGSLINGMLLPDPTDVNGFGLVRNSNGYTTPNPDYLISAPIIIKGFTDKTFCEDDTDYIEVESNLVPGAGDTWEWQVFPNGGTTWDTITDNSFYSDSNTNSLTITKTPASFDGNLYRVRLKRVGRSCDFVTSDPITLKVNRKPKVYNASIGQCISTTNTNPTINLTTAQNDINSEADVSFKFYTDNGATNEILTPNSYPVKPDVPQSVWVTVTDNNTNCVSDIVELVLNVATVTDNNPITNSIQTAFPDDSVNPSTGDVEIGMGFDTDRTTFFVLDKTAIENLLPAIPNTNIFYFENITDRANNVSSIDITGFRNNISKNDVTEFNGYIQFPIYYKMVSTVNNACEGLGEFFVQIYDTPNANSVSDIEECDDAASGSTTDGRNSNINLTNKEPDILGAQDPNTFKVTFHKTEDDAFNGTSEIQGPENYTNDPEPGFTQGTTSEQIIHVRVENIVTGTFNANTSFKIIIQPIPTLSTTITNLPWCDVVTLTDADPRNRIAQNIDLTVKDAEILTGSLSSGYVVEYYNLQEDAEKRINRILDPENFENDQSLTSFPTAAISDEPGIQTIFFVVVDENGLQCPSVVYSFDLEVYPEPYIAPIITTYSDCDNDDDGDDTNGQIQGIDLNGKIPEILGIPDFFNSTERNSNDYKVTFYATPEDAAIGNETNKLPSPYENQNRNETIYIRVENKLTGCVNSNHSFDIVINKLPSFTVTTAQILCLNDLPLNLEVENPNDVYSYQWYDPSGNEIAGATNDNIDINVAGTYRVKAIDNRTFCERIEEIVVNESNVATLDPSFVTIVDESNNIGASNNLSISIDTINNDLGPGDYQFAILNTETNTRTPFAGFQDEPLFENLEGGIYQIIVNDKNGCVPDATLLVSVLQFPKFFTPNGDSQNDFWVIKGANKTFYPNSSINIFNRYGKLVGQFEVGDQGWNGTYNGKLLPSDDYWYNVTLIPSDPTKPAVNRKGNFSLLRR